MTTIFLTSSTPRKLFTYWILALFFAILSWGIVLQFLPEKTTIWNYLFNFGYSLIYYSAAFIGLMGSMSLGIKSSAGKALMFLGLAFTSYGIGLVIWTYYNIFLKVEIPSPSIGDIFFLVLFLPLTSIGFWHLINIFKTMVTKQLIMESFGLLILSLVIIYGLAIRPELSNNIPLLNNLVNAGYPFVDCILLALSLIALRSGGGKIHKGLYTVAVGFLAQVVADILYSFRVAHELYWNGDLSDILFAVSGFIICLGMLQLFYAFSSTKTKPLTQS